MNVRPLYREVSPMTVWMWCYWKKDLEEQLIFEEYMRGRDTTWHSTKDYCKQRSKHRRHREVSGNKKAGWTHWPIKCEVIVLYSIWNNSSVWWQSTGKNWCHKYSLVYWCCISVCSRMALVYSIFHLQNSSTHLTHPCRVLHKTRYVHSREEFFGDPQHSKISPIHHISLLSPLRTHACWGVGCILICPTAIEGEWTFTLYACKMSQYGF